MIERPRVDSIGQHAYPHDVVRKPLNTTLRELRVARGKSLRAAAHDLAVDPAYLSRVERGEKPASEAVTQRAADYYEVPREALSLAQGAVPDDVLEILARHPEAVDELRRK